jgi:hypothetical protein
MGEYFKLRRLYLNIFIFSLAINQLLITDFRVSTWDLLNFPLFHVSPFCVFSIYFTPENFKSFSKNLNYREILGTFVKLLKFDY